jgi:hypothetical protein
MACVAWVAVGAIVVGRAPRANAEPMGTSRVALIDTARMWAAGGITRWATARAKLDDEKPHFVVAEAPAGTVTTPRFTRPDLSGLSPETRERLQKNWDKIDREMITASVTDAAWAAHEAEVLDPITADVERALTRYVAAHGIGLLIDRSGIEDNIAFVAAGVDITDAFVKDYNGRATSPPAPHGKGK